MRPKHGDIIEKLFSTKWEYVGTVDIHLGTSVYLCGYYDNNNKPRIANFGFDGDCYITPKEIYKRE